MLDPEQPGNNGKPQFEAKTRADLEATMTYTLRDILHLLSASPDKALTRFAHMADKNGDRFALELLQPLRGELLESDTDSDTIWSVAALDGSNLNVAIWSDQPKTRRVKLAVAAPMGRQFTVGTRREVCPSGESLQVVESPETATGADWEKLVEIGPR